jgi:crotonobetainyl-CoA:carnitine CoA-transferase CaiB-like acyl-CoA transferase
MTAIGPLEGITVVEIGDDLGLAFCAKYLAALGADVVLASDGPRLSGELPSVRDYVDHGKRVLQRVDVDSDRADVLLGGSAPTEASPSARQVRVTSSDYGEVGPRASWRGTELTLQAAGGLAALVGERDREPLQLGGHQVAYSRGCLAFTGVMTALAERDRTGTGQDVAVSGLETVAYLEWKGRVYHQAGTSLRRGERSGPMVIRCADGEFGFYYRAADWPQIIEALPDDRLRAPEFATHPERIAHRAQLAALLEEIVGSWPRSRLYDLLQGVGVPVGTVCSAADLLDSPQYEARALMVAGPAAGDRMPSIAVEFNGHRPVPATSAIRTPNLQESPS